MYRALRTPNACKTCALGMGGQLGGMVNESGHFPEVCKKSIQAMAADMQGAVPVHFFAEHSFRRSGGLDAPSAGSGRAIDDAALRRAPRSQLSTDHLGGGPRKGGQFVQRNATGEEVSSTSAGDHRTRQGSSSNSSHESSERTTSTTAPITATRPRGWDCPPSPARGPPPWFSMTSSALAKTMPFS